MLSGNVRHFFLICGLLMRIDFKRFALHYLVADTPPLVPDERCKSAFDALLGIAVAGGLVLAAPAGSIRLVAALGASSIILFALPQGCAGTGLRRSNKMRC